MTPRRNRKRNLRIRFAVRPPETREGTSSRPLDLSRYVAIDWDPAETENGNHAHCARHGIDVSVVDEVLNGNWVDIQLTVYTAEHVIVGPNKKQNWMWTLLFSTSWKSPDLVRPVTGWGSKPGEIREWERVTGVEWKGSRQKEVSND